MVNKLVPLITNKVRRCIRILKKSVGEIDPSKQLLLSSPLKNYILSMNIKKELKNFLNEPETHFNFYWEIDNFKRQQRRKS